LSLIENQVGAACEDGFELFVLQELICCSGGKVRYEQVERVVFPSPRALEPERAGDRIERFHGQQQPTLIL
jgi:hypothetical protein